MSDMPRLMAIHLALLAAACAGFASCAVGASSRPASPVLVGTVVHVYDGDTIEVRLSSGPIIVRLHSIDTPEHDQPWGPQATDALASRIAGRQVSLEVVTQDSYERSVADVFLGEENINAWMVKQGDAWAYRRYLTDSHYCAWEDEARAAHRGLWSLPSNTWRAPWQWRAAGRGEAVTYHDYSHETVARCIAEVPVVASSASENAQVVVGAAPAQPGSGKCLIKGNISSKGRIYHLPGSEFYDRTWIDESKGERWFCSEAEALAAGWRPARP
jgi:endonuclease YncB( thermonuclease family)